MTFADLSFLVRVLAFATGTLLYAMLAVMVWRGRPAMAREMGQAPARTRVLLGVAVLGFTLSVATNVLHFSAAVRSLPAPATPVVWIIVCAYAVLMGVIAAHLWRSATSHWLLSATAIAVFAVSAAHLVYYSGRRESLVIDLVVHNASLPLVAALLYNEYRFALADVFLKRALSLVILVSVAATLYVVAAMVHRELGLVLWIGTALCYPALRNAVNSVVDRWVLRRITVRELRARLSSVISTAETAPVVLDRACHLVRDALMAQWVSWHSGDSVEGRAASGTCVVVPVTDAPGYAIDVGVLAGGRRLLSGDMDLLEAVALDVARRIDAIRIADERYERSVRESETLRLMAEAELRALHAQLNPHFLFNALTTIGYLIREAPDRAVETLLRLTELLRAVLRRSSGELVTVRDEVALVESYLAIELARFEERLRIVIDVPAAVHQLWIPPLVIQPLVENAIKHGIGPLTMGGTVSVIVALDTDGIMVVRVRDTGRGVSVEDLARGRLQGVGLTNIERRLEQYYGKRASLTVESAPGMGTMVELRLPQRAA